MSQRYYLCISLMAAALFAFGCQSSDSDDSNDHSSAASECNTSEDCGVGRGCVAALHQCVSIHETRNCMADLDCTIEESCVHLSDRGSDVSAAKTNYCSVRCSTTQDCIDQGRHTKCSSEIGGTDYSGGGDFCTIVPSTCGNNQLDAGEVCDYIGTGNDRMAVFADEKASCSSWQPGSYKDGGRPGCAKTCMGYSKGSGATKCVFADQPDDINGFDTCFASLLVDENAKQAYAVVNYSLTMDNATRNDPEAVEAELKKVSAAILCFPAGTGSGIVMTGSNITGLTSEVASINHSTATMNLTRDISQDAEGASNAVCVVYLQHPVKDSGTKGIFCNLAQSDNTENENLSRCLQDVLASLNQDIAEDADASQFDFTPYQPRMYNSECNINYYPHIKYSPNGSSSVNPGDDSLVELAVWDDFKALKTDKGYSVGKPEGLAIMQAGIAAESGHCSDSMLCSNAKLSLKNITTPSQECRVTKDQHWLSSAAMGTYIVGTFDEKFDEKNPSATSSLVITADGFENYNNYVLTIKGNTLSYNGKIGTEVCGTFAKDTQGKLAFSYVDASGEHIIEKDIILPKDDSNLCCGVPKPTESLFCAATENVPSSEGCNDAPECLDKTYEVIHRVHVPELNSTLKEIHIYLYDQPSKNFRFNTIRLDAVQTAIL